MTPNPLPIIRTPGDCTPEELSAFVALVVEGGEVASAGLRARVCSAARLIFLPGPAGLLGVAALKNPEDRYRARIAASSGVAVPASDFPYELGWVVVAPAARSLGHSSRLSLAALAAAGDNAGVFATSHTHNTRMHGTLHKLGFVPVGGAYPSSLGEHRIQLFLRAV